VLLMTCRGDREGICRDALSRLMATVFFLTAPTSFSR
jgi:hypothetical protein